MSKNKKVFLTRHSKIRFEERTDYNSFDYYCLANIAFKKGYEFARFKEPMAGFLKSISYDSGKYVAKAYDNNIFIFNNCNGHRLLTVYKVPEELLPIEQYLIQNNELQRCAIALRNKKTDQVFYWHEFGGLTDDILEALEFTSQIKAQNYLNNNHEIDSYRDSYEISLF